MSERRSTWDYGFFDWLMIVGLCVGGFATAARVVEVRQEQRRLAASVQRCVVAAQAAAHAVMAPAVEGDVERPAR